MRARSPSNKITFKYYSQDGNSLAEMDFTVRMYPKTGNLSLGGRDVSTVSFAPSPNGYYYVRTRRRPSCMPGRLIIPLEEEVSAIYGAGEACHGINGQPRELMHLEAMKNSFVESAVAIYSAPVLSFMRTECKSLKENQDVNNELWRRNMERNQYAAESRQAMLEAHAGVNRLMNEPAKYATDLISKSSYMATCADFYDKVYAFDQRVKGALVRWPDDIELPCPGDGGDLAEIMLGALEEADET